MREEMEDSVQQVLLYREPKKIALLVVIFIETTSRVGSGMIQLPRTRSFVVNSLPLTPFQEDTTSPSSTFLDFTSSNHKVRFGGNN